MSEPADRALLKAIAALRDALGEVGASHMIIGGVAVIARGVPRQTDDVDATVWAEGLSLERLVEALGRHAIVGRIPDLVAFAHERQVLLLKHAPSGTPMEVTLAWLPFEREALARAERVDFEGVEFPVATAEDLVVYKTVAWRDRDRADIERLLALHGRQMKLDRVRAVVAQFAEALDEPGRVADLETIICRALPDH